jgi:hypothetical protein
MEKIPEMAPVLHLLREIEIGMRRETKIER